MTSNRKSAHFKIQLIYAQEGDDPHPIESFRTLSRTFWWKIATLGFHRQIGIEVFKILTLNFSENFLKFLAFFRKILGPMKVCRGKFVLKMQWKGIGWVPGFLSTLRFSLRGGGRIGGFWPNWSGVRVAKFSGAKRPKRRRRRHHRKF